MTTDVKNLAVTFRDSRIESEWADTRLPTMLRLIVADLATFAMIHYGWIICLLDIFRTNSENEEAKAKTKVHCFWQAIDVRTRGKKREWIKEAVDYVNSSWTYDPSRPEMGVAIYEPPSEAEKGHGTGEHAHFQWCPKTRRAKNEPPNV